MNNIEFLANHWYSFHHTECVKRIYRAQQPLWLTLIATDTDRLASIVPIEFIGKYSESRPSIVSLDGETDGTVRTVTHYVFQSDNQIIEMNTDRHSEWLKTAKECSRDTVGAVNHSEEWQALRKKHALPDNRVKHILRTQDYLTERNANKSSDSQCSCKNPQWQAVSNSESLRDSEHYRYSYIVLCPRTADGEEQEYKLVFKRYRIYGNDVQTENGEEPDSHYVNQG